MDVSPLRAPRALYAAVIALAIAASATSIGNGFAFDDVALVAGNQRIQTLDGVWRLFAMPYWPPDQGASLYRPLVTAGFALQWAVGGGNPFVFHIVSIGLYAAASALAFALFALVIPSTRAAFLAATLFAVHPVHVEAVGNVVGQGELLAGVATLAGSVLYIRARRSERVHRPMIAAIALLFAVACLAKEHALLFPAVLVLIELFAVASRPGRGDRDRIGEVAPMFATLAVVAATYLAVRTLVLGELLGERHLFPVDGVGRLWVMLAVVPHWLRLLFWPARLSAEYSPHHIEIPSGPDLSLLPGLLVVLGLLGLYYALRATRSASSADDRRAGRFAIALAALTLLPVSNLFSVMIIAERALFLPSVAAMLGVGALASAASRRLQESTRRPAVATHAFLIVGAGLVIAGAWRSGARQRVWRDNETLFTQTVLDAPNSYRAQFFYGQLLFEKGRRAEGEKHLRRAIELNPTPTDVSPLNYLATQYRMGGLCAPALPLYSRAIAANDHRPDVRYGLAACLLETGQVAEARRVAEEGVRRGDLRSLFEALIARTDSASRHG